MSLLQSLYQSSFSVQTIDTETGEDKGFPFDSHHDARTPWVSVPLQDRHEPIPENVSNEMFKILYCDYWEEVKNNFIPQRKERKEEEGEAQNRYRAFVKDSL